MEDLKRVFFHELGHIVAHEINKKFYSGTGVKSVFIKATLHNASLFEGEAKVHLSCDEQEKKVPFIERIPEYLATSSYGCMFQAYYMKQPLKDCFSFNGDDDFGKWYYSLREYKLDNYKEEFVEIENEYFEKLKLSAELSDLMKLTPENYLKVIGVNSYEINIELLRNDIEYFIHSHKIFYQSLIDAYSSLIAKYSN